MGCIFILLALLAPRVTMVFIWFLTDWFARVFQTWLWPVLGFILLPYTTLAYMVAMITNPGQVNDLWLVIIAVAAVVDIAHWGGGYRYRRHRHVIIVER